VFVNSCKVRPIVDLLRRCVLSLILQLGAGIVIALIAGGIFKVEWTQVFIYLALIAICVDAIAVVIVIDTINSTAKRLGVSRQDIYEAYIVYRLHKKAPIDEWTAKFVHANLALYRTTGGKPIF
jgi:hypothetical protein